MFGHWITYGQYLMVKEWDKLNHQSETEQKYLVPICEQDSAIVDFESVQKVLG